jgi:hypothetical protein
VDYGTLRTIKQLTSLLEMNECAEHQRHDAILKVFSAWRQLHSARRGLIVGDLERRTFRFGMRPSAQDELQCQ